MIDLLEAKNIGGHLGARSPWVYHPKVQTVKAIINPTAHTQAMTAGVLRVSPKYAALERAFRLELQKIFTSVENKENISPRAYTAVFRKFYYAAFKLGEQISGASTTAPLSPENIRWIDSFIRKELGYWKKFIGDVQAGTGTMDYASRLEMYVHTLKSLFHAGRVIASPPNTLYYWVVGPAEHCPQCLYLKSKSPFTKANLPTIPGSGDSVCKSNCKCKLQTRVVSPAEYHRISSKSLSRDELLKEMRGLVHG